MLDFLTIKFLRYFGLAAVAVGLGSLVGCQEDDTTATPANPTGTVTFAVDHVVGAGSTPAALTLNRALYTNAVGEQFTVSKFNYLLSNFRLKKADGSEYAVPESYFLISANAAGNAASSGTEFTLKDVPTGDYTGVTFLVGVDAPRNMAGAQQGALATTNDMYWNWNQGYIFLKMEGTWRKPNGGRDSLAYHLGGFQDPSNALRTVAPAWPSGTKLLVRTDHAPEVHLKANLLQLLNGNATADQVSFATLPSVHMAGAGALRIANNLSGSSTAATTGTASMFRIDHIHAN